MGIKTQVPEPNDPADTVLDDYLTIKQAREELEIGRMNGCRCPVCGRYAKVYQRKITSAMAYGLILLSKTNGWIHIEDFFKAKKNIPSSIRGDISKLRVWELLERKRNSKNEKEDTNPNNGYYAITQKGRDFVNGVISVEKHAYIWNDTCLRFSDEQTTIQEALTDKFNYAEILGGI